MMDLLNLLIDLEKNENTCFLCFKHNRDNILSIFERIEIQENHSNFTTTLWKISKWLFPSYDILLNQACNDCTEMIIKMYLTLKRSYMKTELLSKLIDNISTKIRAEISSNVQKSGIIIKLKELNVTETCYSENTEECKNHKTTFDSKEIPHKQIKIKHEKVNKAVICDRCGKNCKKPSTLKMHLQCHKQKKCPFCSKMLKSHSHFRIHIKSHNSTIIKRQRNKNYYKCDNCNYRTVNKSTLESHINKIHLNMRPYVCEICSKGFFKKSNLTEHIQTHNSKNNMCEVCGENFSNKKTLNEHLRLHMGQKSFKCDICDHTFYTCSRKNEHIKRKHTERSESCIFCNKKYSLKKDLNSHMKKTHSQASNMQCNPIVGSNV